MTYIMSLKGKKIVLTGKFKSFSRKAAGDRLKKMGATVSGSVSSKTDLLIAGPKAGSKLYKAYELDVPIITDHHLELLLAGQPYDEVLQLAQTFYTWTTVSKRPSSKSLNQLGGRPPGFDKDRWPEGSYGSKRLDHLFTLDLSTMPALQVYFKDARTLSLFCTDQRKVSMYDIGYPDNSAMHLVTSTQEQIDQAGKTLPKGKPAKARGYLKPIEHTWAEREEYFGRSRILGMVPMWCQSEQHQGHFLLQCGEELTVAGDGLVYVFDDSVFAQFT